MVDPARPDPTAKISERTQPQLHELAFRVAVSQPKTAALVADDQNWTYDDLHIRSRRLATLLGDAGVSSGDVVAIQGQRGPHLVCAILAVLARGAAFAILDPAYPTARLARSLKTCKASVLLHLLANAPRPALLGDSGASVLALRVDDLAGGDEVRPAEPVAGAHAYVAFSSGTTGAPHAVLGTHEPVTHFLRWQQRTFALRREDRFAMLAGLSHDPLLRDVFAPLFLGASLFIPDPMTWSHPASLARWLASREVSVVHITPAMGRALVTSAEAATLPSLRYAFFGGDLLTYDDVERFSRLAPNAVCVNFYGTTETPQAMAYHPIGQTDMPHGQSSVPIGRGIDDCQLLVMATKNRLAEVGEVGEVCVRSPYLTVGYMDDDALTRERYLPNPFREDPSDRLYRTGDLGRYMPDGSVAFVGRRDRQVKIGSVRIELEEVEAALRRLPGVRNAIVELEPQGEGREVRPGDAALTAFVEADPIVTTESLRAALGGELPAPAVPRSFIHVAQLALTPNGKVDRDRLGRTDAHLGPACKAPDESVEVQRRVAEIWEEVLGVTPSDDSQDFFDLGGDSLAAIQLTLRLGEAFGFDCPVEIAFERPTIVSMAEYLSGR